MRCSPSPLETLCVSRSRVPARLGRSANSFRIDRAVRMSGHSPCKWRDRSRPAGRGRPSFGQIHPVRRPTVFLTLNGAPQSIPEDWADETLLNLLREAFGLSGAKFGCGVGLCGACTVIVEGVATRSCTLRAGDVGG